MSALEWERLCYKCIQCRKCSEIIAIYLLLKFLRLYIQKLGLCVAMKPAEWMVKNVKHLKRTTNNFVHFCSLSTTVSQCKRRRYVLLLHTKTRMYSFCHIIFFFMSNQDKRKYRFSVNTKKRWNTKSNWIFILRTRFTLVMLQINFVLLFLSWWIYVGKNQEYFLAWVTNVITACNATQIFKVSLNIQSILVPDRKQIPFRLFFFYFRKCNQNS